MARRNRWRVAAAGTLILSLSGFGLAPAAAHNGADDKVKEVAPDEVDGDRDHEDEHGKDKHGKDKHGKDAKHHKGVHLSDPLLDGLLGPLGFAVSKDGSITVAEVFAGRLTQLTRGGEVRTLFEGPVGGGVAVHGRKEVVFTVTRFPEPVEEPELETPGEPGEELPDIEATLERLRPNGQQETLADLWLYEQQNNPDQINTYGFRDLDEACAAQLPEFIPPVYTGILESNPYAVTTDRGGWLVADAAANAILRVHRNGTISTVAVLPPVPNLVTEELAAEFGLPACAVGATYWGEPVPTDVEVGPDGHYYVSSLPGGPELPGSGSVFRVHRKTGEVTQVATGFTMAVDLAISRDGTIYVAELATDFEAMTGRISKIRNGTVSVFYEADTTVSALEIAGHGKHERLYAAMGGMEAPDGVIVVVHR
ncbi:ScyD/ScyE family protein [Egicoccus sp. AB-alg6-2]|uniref:ScyD/ScyE family protein n=1 Tax=Egicoccus sp. AB-alg6-2 TaxID=3242692 RepID=UPI00359D0384